MKPEFTKRQAFIATYTALHRRPPAEVEIQAYFAVTPPAVHDMITALQRRGLIANGRPRLGRFAFS